MDTKAIDSGSHTETLDLSAEETDRDAPRTARDGVRLVPYTITALVAFGIH